MAAGLGNLSALYTNIYVTILFNIYICVCVCFEKNGKNAMYLNIGHSKNINKSDK